VNPHEPFTNPNPPEDSMEEFADLERQLRHALRPVDAPVGFADRVIARAQAGATPEPKRARILMFPKLRSRIWIPSAVAAMLLVGVAGERAHEQMEQRRKAEEAQKQFETALQVTDRALEHARQQLQRAGISFGEE
jgi:predicted nucleic acid-binding protein